MALSSEEGFSRPITSLSPSRLAALDCPARVAFGQMRPRDPTPQIFALAGTIVHQAFENFVESRDARTSWDAAVAAHVGDDDPLDLIPGINRIARRYRRFLAVLEDLIAGPDVVTHAEIELTSRTGALMGTPDLIVEAGGSLTVIDYKSGAVADEGETNHHYEKQVQIYSALATEQLGKPVSRGILWSMKQGLVDVDVSPERLATATTEALAARDDYNDRVPGRQPARPSAEGCRWCIHKPVCDDFWGQVVPGWDLSLGGHAVVGVVDQIEHAADRWTALTLTNPIGTTSEFTSIAGIPSETVPSIAAGQLVRATGLYQPRDAVTTLRWGYASRIGVVS